MARRAMHEGRDHPVLRPYPEALPAADPLNEEAAQVLIRLLGSRCRHAEALRAYQGLAAALERELEVAPLPETEALLPCIQHGP